MAERIAAHQRNAAPTPAAPGPDTCVYDQFVIYRRALCGGRSGRFGRDASLSAVKARLSPPSQTRRILDVLFSFANWATDAVGKRFVRVGMTERFPFLVTRLSPYYVIR